MAILGIDLGTTNSLACVWRDGKPELVKNSLGELLTPSVVCLDENGSLTVGAVAREQLITNPENTASSFKRWMGTHKTFALGGRTFTPPELSALVLEKLRRDAEEALGEPVTEAVISVPAYFNDNQRSATKLAAQLAGLHTERIINEPSAAALAYRLAHGEEDACLIVFDFGGGTLDVSVVECFENVIEITAIAGDNRLGGNDVDEAIARYFCAYNQIPQNVLSLEQQAVLLRQAERCKCTLAWSSMAAMFLPGPDGSSYTLTLTRELLAKLCEDIFDRMKKVLARAIRDSGRSISEIDHVILVGGSSKLAILPDFIASLFGKPPLKLDDPDTIVARGVGICAGIKERSGEIKDVVMTDVCPFTLGTSVVNDDKDQNPHMSVMIERNSVLPVSRSDRFYTTRDNQEKIRVDILQGEEYYARDNLKLGEVLITVPPEPAGKQWVKTTFTYDINGVLQVDVENPSTSRKKTAYVVNPSLHLSEEELEQKLQELAAIRGQLDQSEEEQLLLATAERIFAESTGQLRKEISRLLDLYRGMTEDKSAGPARRHRERAWMKAQLEKLEKYREDGVFDLDLPDSWEDDSR
ncbi:MAG: Hsp70 family protein [Angelakisella sp.]|jgi:molecular chaperone HscC|nr:Hsp70 family protein [Angelakisella sp.]